MEKKWWDSKSLWVVIGIGTIIACEKLGISKEATYQILGLVAMKVGSQAFIDVRKEG